MNEITVQSEQDVTALVREFLAANDPGASPRREFLRAQFDAGLAWVHFPLGLGGLGAPRAWQAVVDSELQAVGAPDNEPKRNPLGLGMAAPTLLQFGSTELQHTLLRPLWTGEDIWCQLFSEPGAGSDLASLATRAVRVDGGWSCTGQKVWTSIAHSSRWGLLLARTDPTVPKHRGLTYFVCDMTAAGVDVRPLRQITGEAEFNEVFLDDVFVPDSHRIGEVGDGWRVAQTTLMNERVAIGGKETVREAGLIGIVADRWRRAPEVRTTAAHDRLLRLWVDAEANRLTAERHRQQLVAGEPGPEGSAVKLAFASLSQAITAFEVELAGEEGLRYDSWALTQPTVVDFTGRGPGYRYLRAKGNSIEGGTSEILRNIIAERVLGLPPEPRLHHDTPWQELPR